MSCPLPIPDYLKDAEIIERRWQSKELSVNPNHSRAISRDILRLIEIVRAQAQYIKETVGHSPIKEPVKTPSINRPKGTIRCTCGRWSKDPFCPVHRMDP